MNQTVEIDQLEGIISRLLEEYGDEVSSILDEEARDCAEKAKKAVQDAAPVDTGKYRDSISVKSQGKAQIVYAQAPYHALTHLLEYGHATAGGTGRTQAFPHWKKGEEYILETFEKNVKKRIEDDT